MSAYIYKNLFMLFGLVTISLPSKGYKTFYRRGPDLSEHSECFARAQSEDVQDVYDYVKSYGHLLEGEIKPSLSPRDAKNKKNENRKSQKVLSIREILNF